MYPGEHGRTTPNKAAVIMGSSGTVVTYAELDERSKRLSRYMAEQGLVRGDMVAIFAENNPRYFEVAWAALRSGLYLVTVNRYLQAEEAAYLITDSTAKAFISTKNQSKVAQEMLAFIPDCPVRLMMDGTVDGFDSYEDALASTTDEAFASQPRGDFMLYSSGTTGRPKGIKRELPGRTLSGQTLAAFYTSVAHAKPLSVGLNCALGAQEMRSHIEELAQIAICYTSAYPNAGLPNAMGEYDEAPHQTAQFIEEWAKNKFVNIVGGCCGTTPDHIKHIADNVKNITPRSLPILDPTI